MWGLRTSLPSPSVSLQCSWWIPGRKWRWWSVSWSAPPAPDLVEFWQKPRCSSMSHALLMFRVQCTYIIYRQLLYHRKLLSFKAVCDNIEPCYHHAVSARIKLCAQLEVLKSATGDSADHLYLWDLPTSLEEITLTLSRSRAFIREPCKYLTLVCCLFKSPSNSKSGSALSKNIQFLILLRNIFLPVKKHHFNINIFSVFMEKIFEEMWDWLVSDVSAHHDMPEMF